MDFCSDFIIEFATNILRWKINIVIELVDYNLDKTKNSEVSKRRKELRYCKGGRLSENV